MDCAESYRYCRRLARRTGKNFYYSFLTLPRQKRLAMCAIYAWMRLLDDCVDDAATPEEGKAALERWEKETKEVLSGPEGEKIDALWPAFVDTVKRYGIPHEYFFEIIRGAEMDLTIKSYNTFEELYQYCYRVASVVGLTCLHIFDFTHDQAKKHGEWLGIAFQLTNILRDIKEDAQRGRVYLPIEDLRTFDLSVEDLLKLRWSDKLHDCIESYSYRAETFYLKAQPLMEMVSKDARSTLQIMTEIYGGILKKLRKIDYDVFNQRATLTTLNKVMVVLSHRFQKKSRLRQGVVTAPDLRDRKIGIIGGGVSGLAAAAILSEFEMDITLFEKAQRLGGKAAFFSDVSRCHQIDNPFHIWLEANQSISRFFSMTGSRRFFRSYDGWQAFVGKKFEEIKPACRSSFPINWKPVLKKLSFSRKERSGILKGIQRLLKYGDEGQAELDRVTFSDWARYYGQNERMIESFWKPFLNIGIVDRINRLSCQEVVSYVCQLAAVEGSVKWLVPSYSVSDIYDHLRGKLSNSRHVTICMSETVSRVFFEGQWHVVTASGKKCSFDEVILALPLKNLREILDPKDYSVLSKETSLERLEFNSGLLVSIDLKQHVFERQITLLDEPPFTRAVSEKLSDENGMVRMTFAGIDGKPLLFVKKPELLNQRLWDVFENISDEIKLPVKSEVLCEVDRDFASVPGNNRCRPSQKTSLPGLWLAGDWTQTGFSAGLEGSANSGFLCAKKILEERGWSFSGSTLYSSPSFL